MRRERPSPGFVCGRIAAPLLLCLAAADGSAAPGENESRPIEGLLPADAWLSLSVGDLGAFADRLSDLPLARILADEDVAEFFAGPLQALRERLSEALLAAGLPVAAESFPATAFDLGRAFLVAVRDEAAAQGDSPSTALVIGIEDRSPDSALARALDDALDAAVQAGNIEVEEHPQENRREIRRHGRDPPVWSLHISRSGGFLLCGTSAAALSRARTALEGRVRERLSDRPGFRAVANRLGLDGPAVARFYLDGDALAEILRASLAGGGEDPGDSLRLWRTLGLDGLRQVGLALDPSDGRARIRAFLRADRPRRGLLALCPSPPLDRDFFALAPRDALRVWLFHLDLHAAWRLALDLARLEDEETAGEIESLALGFGKRAGVQVESLLRDLGPQCLLIMEKGSHPLLPALFLVVRCEDAPRARDALVALLRTSGLEIARGTYDGSDLFHVQTPLVTPALCAIDGALVLGSDLLPTRNLIRHIEKGGASILDRPEVAAALEGIPADEQPVGICFHDAPASVARTYGLLASAGALGVLDDLPFDPDELPPAESITRHLFPSVVTSRAVPDGIVFDHTGPLLDQADLLIVGLGALAGSVRRVSDRAAQALAQAQIRNLVRAVESFRRWRDRLPGSLEELTIPDPENFDEPYLYEIPPDPWGNPYVYRISGDDFEILSYGADGKPGGEGRDADLSSACIR